MINLAERNVVEMNVCFKAHSHIFAHLLVSGVGDGIGHLHQWLLLTHTDGAQELTHGERAKGRPAGTNRRDCVKSCCVARTCCNAIEGQTGSLRYLERLQ